VGGLKKTLLGFGCDDDERLMVMIIMVAVPLTMTPMMTAVRRKRGG